MDEEHFKEVSEKVIKSDTKYFLITKNPQDMKELLVDFGFDPVMKHIVVGPCNDRPGATKLGNNQSITQEEAQALEDLTNAGYTVEFALIKEKSIGEWPSSAVSSASNRALAAKLGPNGPARRAEE